MMGIILKLCMTINMQICDVDDARTDSTAAAIRRRETGFRLMRREQMRLWP
jgi:hypothetical protein